MEPEPGALELPVGRNGEIYHFTKGRDRELVPYYEPMGGGTRAGALELLIGRNGEIYHATKGRDGEPFLYG